MRRRINCPDEAAPVAQLRVDQRKEMVEAILAQVRENMTLPQIAELLGFSHEWVRVRLAPLANGPNAQIFGINGRYRVPKAVVEQFVRSVFS